jgi:hypothetical protein
MTGRKFYGQPSDVVGSKEYALVITNMKKTLTVYVFLSIAPCVIFLILHVLYRPSVRLTVLYAAVSILGALLIFFGTYGKITLFTLYVILIGQPFIAHFFVVDFHTLRPNFLLLRQMTSACLEDWTARSPLPLTLMDFAPAQPMLTTRNLRFFWSAGRQLSKLTSMTEKPHRLA